MSALFALLLAAQPQELLKAELVRVEKGSALALTFKYPVSRRSLPVVPKGRRLTVKLPVSAPAHLTGQREPIGMIRGIQLRGRRIILSLNRDAKGVANEGVVIARRRVWYLRMLDPTASRDLADVLLGTTPRESTGGTGNYQPIDLPPVKISAKGAEAEAQSETEEGPNAASALAAVAAAAGGQPDTAAKTADDDATETAVATDPLAPPPPSPLGQWLRIGAGFALLLFGIAGFVLYRRRRDDHEEAFGLKVVSRARLDPKNSVAVLEVGGAVLVIGLSDAGPSLLTRLDEETGLSQDDELGRLRRLVADDPGRRIESWLSQVGQEGSVPTTTTTPAPAAVPVTAAAAPPRTQPFTEIEDLKARLAEIRMKS